MALKMHSEKTYSKYSLLLTRSKTRRIPELHLILCLPPCWGKKKKNESKLWTLSQGVGSKGLAESVSQSVKWKLATCFPRSLGLSLCSIQQAQGTLCEQSHTHSNSLLVSRVSHSHCSQECSAASPALQPLLLCSCASADGSEPEPGWVSQQREGLGSLQSLQTEKFIFQKNWTQPNKSFSLPWHWNSVICKAFIC